MGKKKVRIDRAESTVQERIVGAEEKKTAGRKLYHTASLGSLLYVTRIRNEETNDRPNESASLSTPHSPLASPLSHPSFAPRPRHHSFSSSRAAYERLQSERDRFLSLTRLGRGISKKIFEKIFSFLSKYRRIF